ncbi:LamG domain-containing protein [Kitasatospora sp. DSM 101779]|uniref:LamG domain-containing protein n=1 Tax=Kitasatospora sp. DSM 101779 TaxID=2853165 RepID=UPI0021D81C6A|nr:LamG domain-containing protein [Kitasatospora sp. DSM 101779]MCU7823798.1 LamG domain-containing protein [Kitasatospora sp. DSM 101779]
MSDGGGTAHIGSGGTPGPGGAPDGTGPAGEGRPAYLLPPVGIAPPGSPTPDWAALAESNERQQRRRRLLMTGGAVAGVLAVAGIVATALLLRQDGPDGPRTAEPTALATVAVDGPPSAVPSVSAASSPPPSASATPSGAPSGSPSAGRSATPSAAPTRLDDLRGARPAALGQGAAVGTAAGHTGPALLLHGSADGWAQTSAAVVDTSKSFTVSAVVRNDAATGARAVVSQGTGSYYSFYLGRDYWGSHNQWVFKVQTAAGGEDSTSRQAFSTGQATTGQWVMLTGVYDAGTKQIRLYVNGAPAQTTSVSGIWQTTGPLQIGRTRWKNTWTDPWDGALTNVQIWSQALPAERVTQLWRSGGTAAGTQPAAGWLLP